MLAVVVVFGCMVLLVVGCEKAVQTNKVSARDVSVNSLVPEAFRIVQQGLTDDDPRVRANAIEVVVATKTVPCCRRCNGLRATSLCRSGSWLS